ncbi:MAG: HAMP domain-containing protein, partial [Simkaniaceae bacterium]|nr:HAMP domain-containing protein [Simkaniaceae bacterium]
MADFSFRGKPSQKRKNKPFYGLSQSLAVRVLLASLLFLVVPLLFFSIVLYVHDYHDKIRDNDKILQMLSHEKSLYLQKSLEYQMMLLTIIDETTETSQKEFSLKRFNQFLHQHVLKKEVEALFYLISDHNGNAACAASSDLAMVGEDFSFLLDDRDFIKPGFAIYIDERSPYTVYLMKEVKRWGEVTGLIVLELPKNILLDQLHSSASFASTVSLMNKRDKVILSTSPTMEEQILRKEHDKPTVALTPLKNFQGEYRFEFEGTSRIGIKSQIENTNFSLFIDIPEYLSFMEFEGYLTRITSLFIIILLVGGGGTIWITFRIAKPLKRLGKVMQDVGDGDFNSRYKKDWMGFEINALGKVFNEMLESLIVQIDAVRHERVEKETYARELMLGQEMQKSLLPKTLPEFP